MKHKLFLREVDKFIDHLQEEMEYSKKINREQNVLLLISALKDLREAKNKISVMMWRDEAEIHEYVKG